MPVWCLVAAFLAVTPSASPVGSGDISWAAELYQRTDYARAMSVLRAAGNFDAPADVLAGKISFMRGDLGVAGEYFQKAVVLAPGNAEYVLWLGRTWARKAESANPFTAPRAA